MSSFRGLSRNDSHKGSLKRKSRARHRNRRRSSALSSIGRANLSSTGTFSLRPSSSSSDVDRSSRSRSRSEEREKLKLHKEVIEQVKFQLWPLDKKMRIIRQAKEYLQRHESEIEQRLAQEKTFASRMKHVKLLFYKFLQLLWKLFKDLLDRMIPWQQRIKDIESHFGSVVSSYFVFLR